MTKRFGHIINRIEEYVADGRDEGEAIPYALSFLARELTTSSFTTAFTF